MSLGLAVFDKLCQVGNELEALKDVALPGSDTWCGLCELLLVIDACIDMLVDSAPLEKGGCAMSCAQCRDTEWCPQCQALAERAGLVAKNAPYAVSEKTFQSAVMRLAKANRWRCYHVFDARKSEKGFPDLTLCRPPLLLFAELKREGETPTIEQCAWLAALQGVPGVSAHVWYPSDMPDIIALLTEDPHGPV